MSLTYSIRADFNNTFSKDTILHILQKGHALGLVYYSLNGHGHWDIKILDINETVKKIVEYKPADSAGNFILAKFEDTVFYLLFFKTSDNLLGISFANPRIPWMKKSYLGYGENYELDYARYIRLLLPLAEKLILKKLKTSSDYYNNYVIDGKQTEIYLCALSRDFDNLKQCLQLIYFRSKSRNISLFEDEQYTKKINLDNIEYYQTLCLDKPVTLFAQTTKTLLEKEKSIFFKLHLEKDFIKIYPLQPFILEKSENNNSEILDLNTYLNIGLTLTNDLVIWEIAANSSYQK